LNPETEKSYRITESQNSRGWILRKILLPALESVKVGLSDLHKIKC